MYCNECIVIYGVLYLHLDVLCLESIRPIQTRERSIPLRLRIGIIRTRNATTGRRDPEGRRTLTCKEVGAGSTDPVTAVTAVAAVRPKERTSRLTDVTRPKKGLSRSFKVKFSDE